MLRIGIWINELARGLIGKYINEIDDRNCITVLVIKSRRATNLVYPVFCLNIEGAHLGNDGSPI